MSRRSEHLSDGQPRLLRHLTIARVVGLFSTLLVTGCISGFGQSVPPGPAQDDLYAPVLERWTREAQVFSKFQKRVDISAVLLTDEMRRAVGERLARLRGTAEGLTVLSDTSGGARLGVLVSVFTPDAPYMDLDDRSLWSLALRVGSQQQPPLYVRRVSDKTPLKPFFSHIHQWSQDYLLVFDFPEKALQSGSADSKVSPTAEFISQSAIAKVELRWP